jgi:hypothetical protein
MLPRQKKVFLNLVKIVMDIQQAAAAAREADVGKRKLFPARYAFELGK